MLTGKAVSRKGDIRGLGVIGYELCELKHMFEENSRDAVKEAILKNVVPKIGSRVSEELQPILIQMLQKNPNDRIELLSIIEQLHLGANVSPLPSL